MAKRRSTGEIDRLRTDIARTRRELGDTWAALRARLMTRRGRGTSPLDLAGGKPGAATSVAARRHPTVGMLLAGAAGLAMVVPRMLRKRSAPPIG